MDEIIPARCNEPEHTLNSRKSLLANTSWEDYHCYKLHRFLLQIGCRAGMKDLLTWSMPSRSFVKQNQIQIYKDNAWKNWNPQGSPLESKVLEVETCSWSNGRTSSRQYCTWAILSLKKVFGCPMTWSKSFHFIAKERVAQEGIIACKLPHCLNLRVWHQKIDWGSDTSTSQFGSKIP